MFIQTAKLKILARFISISLVILGCFFLSSTPAILAQEMPTLRDPLPSWNEGQTKSAILDFVERVTTEDSSDFIPVEDRIATFDNDGTLWAEQPLIQGMFVLSKLKVEIAKDPSLKDQPIFQALLAGDIEYLTTASGAELTELLAAINSGITEEKFEQEVQEFFQAQTHPTLGVAYTELAY
ncbi:MAG: haloacid dehalogenase-like hydrolase, partial [Cyanobacteriota bacterium]|nr:haloacid dehalogenase-like hydrolase [Cyanobacteriota bacterium]